MMAKFVGLMLLLVVRLLTGAQARWWGCPPKAEQRIYFANHQSHADLVLIWAALPEELRSITRPIAAKDYWTASRLKYWITHKVFNAIYVDRSRNKDAGPDAGDPLEPSTRVQRVWVRGREIDPRNRHTRLMDKYQAR